MHNQALKRRTETGVTARIPLLPPPVPKSVPDSLFSDREIQEIGKKIGLDDQIVALKIDDDELAAQIAQVRRTGKNTAREIGSHLDRVENDVRIAHSLAAEARRDVRALKVTSDDHAAMLEQHRLGLVNHATHIEALRQEVEDNFLLAASQERLEALQARLDELEVREAGNYGMHGSYGNLAREVAILKLQLVQLQHARASAPAPQVAKTRTSWLALLTFYGSIATAIGATVVYVISKLG